MLQINCINLLVLNLIKRGCLRPLMQLTLLCCCGPGILGGIKDDRARVFLWV